ncbi:unannotated protein [freshwater metagenome]|uniref:Unannotated protein n=2 Tax=freshwater metagenome TaxID=449393 RepID=A0A6J7LAA6_9ZZZZ|nr:hypothetical protein [Actinomycetota bacterium]
MAVCDTNPERVAAALELAPNASTFSDATEMLDSGLLQITPNSKVLDSQSNECVTIHRTKSYPRVHIVGMTTRTLGALMESDEENSNSTNEIEQHLINDLQDQWKEPATKGDLRNHAVRMDSRFGKLDSRFDTMDARFGVLRSDLQAMIHRNVWASAAAIMTLNLAALGLVVSILK